jgi:outer membrane lipoprotein LolB
MVLSGCASRIADVSETQKAAKIAQQQLDALTVWSVRGKLAIISPDERKSANLSWQQENEKISMLLTSVVGSTIARMTYDGEMATLEADGQNWQDPSPSVLIYQVTGWDVPVEQLAQWMKASVEQQHVSDYFENGLVKQIVTKCTGCLPWVIDYTRYGEFLLNDRRFTLPTSMRLEQSNTQTKLILRIDDWSSKGV